VDTLTFDALTFDAFVHHPLAVWIEQTFGVEERAGHLHRRIPITLAEGAARLAEATGLDAESCRAAIQACFRRGTEVRDAEENPVFAFKLHQFIAQGGAVYATAEPPERCHLTLEGQHYAPGAAGERLLFPLLFCRECGQAYYQVYWEVGANRLRPSLSQDEESARGGAVREGYLLVEDPAAPVWDETREDDLPDAWFNQTRAGAPSNAITATPSPNASMCDLTASSSKIRNSQLAIRNSPSPGSSPSPSSPA
jgi:hypothetical protein